MPSFAHARPRRLTALLLASLAAGLLASTPSVAATALVRTAHNAVLRHTILVDHSGHSLYALSAERRGRFICTDSACLSLWKPLVVREGVRPTGTVGHLATIKRPDGKLQVTYRGRPLYTFTEDRRRGQVNGEGFRDVGVWHAVVARR